MRTFLGFDTLEDALTFKRFLMAEGYKNIDLCHNRDKRLFEVHFNRK